MFARIKAAVARGEVERKGARQSRAQQQRGERGQTPSSPATAQRRRCQARCSRSRPSSVPDTTRRCGPGWSECRGGRHSRCSAVHPGVHRRGFRRDHSVHHRGLLRRAHLVEGPALGGRHRRGPGRLDCAVNFALVRCCAEARQGREPGLERHVGQHRTGGLRRAGGDFLGDED